MVDLIKGSGELLNIQPDSYCKIGRKKRDTITGKMKTPIIIPNVSGNENLILWTEDSSNEATLAGNFRKWRFGSKNAVLDLNKQDFADCIKLIALRLGVSVKQIYDLNIKKIEFGANLKLSVRHAGIIQMLMDFPYLKRDRYNENSVYFRGTKEEVICYNKLVEMKARIRGKTPDARSKAIKKLLEHVFILRVERKIFSTYGIKLQDEVETLGSVYENWDFLVDEWLQIIFDMKVIDGFSKVKAIEPNSMTPFEFSKYLQSLTLEVLGVENTLDLARKYVNHRKSLTVEKLVNIYNEFKSVNNRNYLTEVSSVAAIKAGLMKSNISHTKWTV